MFLFHLQEGVLLMETLEMAPSRETVTMGCYVWLMGNAWVCLEYLFIVIFSDEYVLTFVFYQPPFDHRNFRVR